MSRIRINIEKVNEKFENFARFLISHRALLLVSFIALLAISIVGMKKIYVEASWDSYFIEGDPMLVETDKFKETFGNDYFVGVMVETEQSVLTPENLKLLRELSNELRDSLSYSDCRFGIHARHGRRHGNRADRAGRNPDRCSGPCRN